jgi:hypothetical protein
LLDSLTNGIDDKILEPAVIKDRYGRKTGGHRTKHKEKGNVDSLSSDEELLTHML